jgi:hypothetical protein
MTNDVANITNMRGAISGYRQQSPKTGGTASYLTFSKGDWTQGRDARGSFDLDTSWIIHPNSFTHGYICWRDGALFKEVLVGLTARLPLESELPEPPEPKAGSDDQHGYQRQRGFTAACVDGILKGSQVIFKTATVGGLSAIDALLDEMEARFDQCEADGNPAIYPVVQFGTDSYIHKTRGKIWVPQITVVGFSTGNPADPVEWLDGEVEAEPAPKPASKPAISRRLMRSAG